MSLLDLSLREVTFTEFGLQPMFSYASSQDTMPNHAATSSSSASQETVPSHVATSSSSASHEIVPSHVATSSSSVSHEILPSHVATSSSSASQEILPSHVATSSSSASYEIVLSHVATSSSSASQEIVPNHAATSSSSASQEILPSQPATSSSSVSQEIVPSHAKKRKGQNYAIREGCGDKCRRRCKEISDENRLSIHASYWQKDVTSQKKWLYSVVRFTTLKCRTAGESSNRTESRYYFLPKQCDQTFELIAVCKSFFLSTLGYKTDSILTTLSSNVRKDITGGFVKENRGGSTPKIDKHVIILHINSYNPIQPHYRRHNAPYVRYLPREITIKSMFSDFIERNPGFCSIRTYEKVFHTENISLKMPKSDICEVCETAMLDGTDVTIHKKKAVDALNEYRDDVDRNPETTFSFDLQKVILLPSIEGSKLVIFTPRLIAFNLTFAPVAKSSKQDAVCLLWHEAVCGRHGEDIASAIIKFLQLKKHVECLTLYADNCAAQNKNWILFSSLVQIVNSNERSEN